ncbi:hypothetical protein [Fulvivirga lutea]|uniref:CMP/dCMP-type deaminase domain-containing protein n=1 Tax=Fulvivirga lutea TaxID=2810512 RepID=A0A974WI25_9BACT|nr:hypothetical protein [Fulvivirga lutea]QSE96515.1 hypothetical protein JR347_13010 [Fulvivirga lutea]
MVKEDVFRLTIEEEKKCKSEQGKISPRVSAAIVKEGALLGVAHRGQHNDGDHAEYTLFEKELKDIDVSGAILFTTLEPCTSRKTHKPCADWIIEKGISKIYIGMLDPNPKIYLAGVRKLKDAKIDIEYYDEKYRLEIEADNKAFIEQYKANPKLEGQIIFDYTNNNGTYTVGYQEYMFDLKFSNASNRSIHIYNDNANIDCISEVLDCTQISQIVDASIYDSSSRSRTINNSGIAIFRNINGHYCAIKINSISARSHGDKLNEVNIDYKILTAGSDFRNNIG